VALALFAAAEYVALPARAPFLDARGWRPRVPVTIVRGAYHVHTRRSDGSGTLDEVARAASRAGLDFVIVTDHGDGTRAPEPPRYRSGVLCIDAVEVSTTGGHYVALGMTTAPYPLAGEPRDVVEDVRRLGGMGIVAHPDSPKRSLAWQDWNVAVDGVEWINADSEWRDESRRALVSTLLHYPWRDAESVVALFDRPVRTLVRWDDGAGRGAGWVALGGLDAHARFGWRGLPDENGEGGPDAGHDDGLALAVPSYESMFRALTTRVELDRSLTGDGAVDSAAVLSAIRAGRVYTVLDGRARGGALEFVADTPHGPARMGGRVARGPGAVRLQGRALAPAGSRLVLRRNGAVVASSTGLSLSFDVDRREAAAAYRLEVEWDDATPGRSAPWIVTNAISVGSSPVEAAATAITPVPSSSASSSSEVGRFSDWRLEKDALTRAAVAATSGADGLVFEFGLASAGREAWAAAAAALPAEVGVDDEVRFSAQANHPLRLSVQVRAPGGAGEQRWRRSVYLDQTPRRLTLPFNTLLPIDTASTPRLPLADITALLVVVDTVHTRPGAAGTVTFDELWMAR